MGELSVFGVSNVTAMFDFWEVNRQCILKKENHWLEKRIISPEVGAKQTVGRSWGNTGMSDGKCGCTGSKVKH